MLDTATQHLRDGGPLSAEQISAAVENLVTESVPAEAKADFLIALAKKGETPEEIAGFVRELRGRSVRPPLDAETRGREILDVCGTGGDKLGTFNISTTVAIICAAAGVTVAKHGNRAITSQAGSADVLEALGIRIDLAPEEAARWLKERNFAFFFAPNYHPAFKHIAPARKRCAERGERTIFNFLGPLLNPALPTCQLIGVPRPQLCEPIARVLQSIGVRRGMVVCGRIGSMYLDEFSTLGDNTVAEFYQERGFTVSALSPDHFPIQSAQLSDLLGSDKHANARIVRNLLCNEERGAKRDAVLLNAAAALMLAGSARSMSEGWDAAAQTIDSGKARQKLEQLSSP